jgi:gamma-glutamyltranspeptidase
MHQLQYEPAAFTDATATQLRAMGYVLRSYAPWGSAQIIVVDPEIGALEGGSDRRTPAGAALGL